MMSGADAEEIISQNVDLPFLPKPFDGQTLKARVQVLLVPPGEQPSDLSSDDSDVGEMPVGEVTLLSANIC